MEKHKSIKYTNEFLGELKIISDFLPTPEDLALKEEPNKIKLLHRKSSENIS